MKQILILSIAILILGFQNVLGQTYLNYYKEINNAEIANLDEAFYKSDSLYQIAFDLVEKPFKDDYLLAAINAEKLVEYEKVYKYLKSGIRVGLTIKSIKKALSSFKKSAEWKMLNNNYDSIRKKYLNGLNLTLREELLKMVDKDQAVRNPIFGSVRKMQKTDAKNYIRLLEIIKENNCKWPGRFIIGDGNEGGKYAYGEVTIMLHHFSKEQVDNLKPVLVDAILRGDLSPYNVAYPLDYKNLEFIGERKRRGKTISYDVCQPIGSYGVAGNDKIVICDCEKAEYERHQLGLESLDDYFRKRNMTYECYEEK